MKVGGPVTASMPAQVRAGLEGRSGQGNKTAENFEAMLLGVLLDQALPKGGMIFGQGLAGNVARSQLGQQLAQELAKNGSLGIAAMLADGTRTFNRS